MGEVREAVAALAARKAEAAAVAGKADRDYVENALDRLRGDVRRAVTDAAAGVSDALGGSLAKVRGDLDGKASHADVARLQSAIAALYRSFEDSHVPDGLAGVKAFRCLSCNRHMDSMRPRPTGIAHTGLAGARRAAGGAIPPLVPPPGSAPGGARAARSSEDDGPGAAATGGASMPPLPRH